MIWFFEIMEGIRLFLFDVLFGCCYDEFKLGIGYEKFMCLFVDLFDCLGCFFCFC